MSNVTMTPIGWVRSPRTDPADSDHWGEVLSTIEIEHRYGDDSLVGLGEFSHVEVVYHFDQAVERPDYLGTRRPRGRSDLPLVGVFADRGPRRPNRIGVSVARIVSVAGRSLQVRGLDAVDGTPVLDLKPVMTQFVATDVHEPQWVADLMQDYFRP